MPFDARAVANHFLDLSEAKGCSLTPMKIQKLVYFAHGWHLAVTNGDALIDEQVEAWPYGPVIPSLYRSLRGYGDQSITDRIKDFRRVEKIDGHYRYRTLSMQGDSEKESFARSLLDRVWEIYAPFTAIQLSNMTHQPGTPWYQVYSRYKVHGMRIPKGTDIPLESIHEFFRTRLRPAESVS